MSVRQVGVIASGEEIKIVDAEVPETGAITIIADVSMKLQKGDRAKAYRLMHQRVSDYVHEKKISRAVIKASAVSQAGKPTLAHFQSAELRGVAISALCHGGADVDIVAKATVSKTFGERKADEYVKDNSFWDDNVTGAELRGGSREAALLILASRDK